MQCANEHCVTGLAHVVKASMKTMRSVEINHSRRAELGGITRCEAPDAVGGLIIVAIGLRLDDLATTAIDEKIRV